MRKIYASVAIAALFALSLCAGAQVPPNPFKGEPVRSLSELAGSQLSDPKVLVAINATQEQIFRGQLRAIMDPIRKASIANIQSSGDTDQILNSLQFTARLSGVKIGDLDGHQKQRLFEITVQTLPLEALMTDEVAFSLHLDGSQRKNLTNMYKTLMAEYAQVVAKVLTSPDIKKGLEEFQALSADVSNDPTVDRVNHVADKTIDFYPKLIVKVNEKIAPHEAQAVRKAMRLLTPLQRKELKKLGGKPTHS